MRTSALVPIADMVALLSVAAEGRHLLAQLNIPSETIDTFERADLWSSADWPPGTPAWLTKTVEDFSKVTQEATCRIVVTADASPPLLVAFVSPTRVGLMTSLGANLEVADLEPKVALELMLARLELAHKRQEDWRVARLSAERLQAQLAPGSEGAEVTTPDPAYAEALAQAPDPWTVLGLLLTP